MQSGIYTAKAYKAYCLEWLHSQPEEGRGQRSVIAKAMGCQTAYVSQVLNGNAHLSAEQAHALSKHMGHNEEEMKFFLLLVQKDRAGTKDLKDYYERELELIRKNQLILKTRWKVGEEISREDQATYYSSWHYAAIHMLVTVPGFHSKSAIAKRLQLSLESTANALQFLVRTGLVAEEASGKFTGGKSRMHLGNQTADIIKHHTNWRLRALTSLDREALDELHYSSAVSIAIEDAKVIKELFVKAIENAKQKIRDSKEEEIYSLCLDFFKV